MPTHGLSRVGQYITHQRNGRDNGAAVPQVPQVLRRKGGALIIDAQERLAFAASDLAVQEAVWAAQMHAVALAEWSLTICGRRPSPAWWPLGFSNSPAAGGKHPIFGTNPVAAILPRRDAAPLMLHLCLSEAARGKLMVAAKEGRSIPAGWALDAQGQPTTSPQAGLAGSMLPIGAATSSKGAMLALVVELLVNLRHSGHWRQLRL